MTMPYFPPPYQAQVPQDPPGEVPLNKPYYGISIGGALKRFFSKYAVFSGRASRSEYWWVALVFGVVYTVWLVGSFALAIAISPDSPEPPAILWVMLGLLLVAFLAVIVPSIAVGVRRLHDADLSGWLILLSLIPSVGWIIQIVLMVLPSKPEGARFDDDAPPCGYGEQPYPQAYPGASYPPPPSGPPPYQG